MRQKLRFASAVIGGLAISSAGLSQELSVESGTDGELSRQTTTRGELPAASGFQELNADKEPPLPYIAPEPKEPVVATKPVVEPVTVEPKPKVKKAKKTAKKVAQPAVTPKPSSPDGKIRLIPIEEIPIIGIEVVSDTEKPTTPQSSESRNTGQIDRN